MGDILLTEVFVDQLIFTDNVYGMEEVNLDIKISNLLEFTIQCGKRKEKNVATTTDKFFIGGKTVFFTSDKNKVIEALKKDMTITIKSINGSDEKINDETIGTVKVIWYSNLMEKLSSDNAKFVREINQYDILQNGKKVGVINLNMVIMLYGPKIEVTIYNNTASFVNIPLKTSHATRKIVAQPEGEWDSLFNNRLKPTRSFLDENLKIYAQMAGVISEPVEKPLLTPDYINSKLCGYKQCPGAMKFREYGLGPLATPGGGLGSIKTIKDAKPCGVYGMSQSYGTMDYYGPYGLLINKQELKENRITCGASICEQKIYDDDKSDLTKTCCNTITKNQYVECFCECCGKLKYKKVSKPCPDCPAKKDLKDYKCKGAICPHIGGLEHIENINCNSPDCPNATPVEDVTCKAEYCPYSEKNANKCCVERDCPTVNPKPKRRQSAGADKVSNYNDEWKPKKNIYSILPNINRFNYNIINNNNNNININNNIQSIVRYRLTRQIAGADGNDNIGEECEYCNYDDDDDDDDDDHCPFTGSFTYEYGLASTSKWRSRKNLPSKCKDPNCSFINLHEKESFTTDSTWEKPIRINEINTCDTSTNSSHAQRKNYSPNVCCKCLNNDDDDDDLGITCSEDECIKASQSSDECNLQKCIANFACEEPLKLLSLLMKGDGQKMVFANNTNIFDVNKLTNVYGKGVPCDPCDMMSMDNNFSHNEEEEDGLVYLIARLLAQRELSGSLNNFYTDHEHRPSGNVKDLNWLPTEESPDKQDKDKKILYMQESHLPCKRDTCRNKKYVTCSECGGISRSGATCLNSDISFSHISYSDDDKNLKTPETVNVAAQPVTVEKKKKEDKTDVKNVDNKTAHTDADKKENRVTIASRKRSRFVYHLGEEYPMHLGHKICSQEKYKAKVPANMGWLWTTKPEGVKRRRANWKPGMINDVINQRIIEYRRIRGIPDPPELKMIHVQKTKKKVLNPLDEEEESEEEVVQPKPTLIVQKKHGNYLITMNPLKDPRTLVPLENPYMTCKPMQFIITKPKRPVSTKKKSTHVGDADSSFENILDECECDVKEITRSNSSSESELNIEFTTPAGLIYPEEMKRPPNIVQAETQFEEADFTCSHCPTILPSKYAKKKKTKISHRK